MNVEEALEIVQTVVDNGSLSKVQEIVFRHCWERQSYMEIALDSGYEVGYIRDVGYKLWQSLSKAFGKKVTKNNFQGILKHQCIALRTSDRQGKRWQLQSNSHLLVDEVNSGDCQRDWGDAIDVSVFYGRDTELAALKQWLQDRCRLVTLLGMEGIGKTSLAVKLAEQIQDEFEFLIWRSLRNPPPLAELIGEIVQFLSGGAVAELPDSLDAQLSYLMTYLRSSRCLIILDNYESLLRSGEIAGRYRSGYEGYSELIRRVADERHKSSLILTSREKPIGIAAKESKTLPVRSLCLGGLPSIEAHKILQDKGISDIQDETKKLIDLYNGNPILLRIAATTIQSLFNGNVFKFLEQDTFVFGEIWELLERQFNRLSILEKRVMYWLAKNRQLVTLSELRQNGFTTVSQRELLEALESLQHRSLVGKNFYLTQQTALLEFLNAKDISRLVYS